MVRTYSWGCTHKDCCARVKLRRSTLYGFLGSMDRYIGVLNSLCRVGGGPLPPSVRRYPAIGYASGLRAAFAISNDSDSPSVAYTYMWKMRTGSFQSAVWCFPFWWEVCSTSRMGSSFQV